MVWLRVRKYCFDHPGKRSLVASGPLQYFPGLVSCNQSSSERGGIYIVESDYLRTQRPTALARKRSGQLCSSTLSSL